MDEIDFEWGRDGADSARRHLITPAEVMRVLLDPQALRADTRVSRWHIGETAESGVIVVVTDRVGATRIHEISTVRPAYSEEIAAYRSWRNR